MKKIIITALFATITLISCKEGDKENMTNEAEQTVNEIENATEEIANNVESETSETITYSKEQATEMANDFESNVVVKDGKIISIKGYDGYSRLQSNWSDLQKANISDMKMKSESLRSSFNEFKSTIPSYLRVDDVNDAIRDVEKELKEYETEMVGNKATEKNNRENMEEIQEAFDDLEKEMIQARQKFIDNKEDAMEEYMEEINSSRNQTTTEKYLDATEEYNEEMKDK
jgi:DNA-binding NarL/FixJ family response regulator